MVDRGRREFEYIHHQREREHWYKQGGKRRWQGLSGLLAAQRVCLCLQVKGRVGLVVTLVCASAQIRLGFVPGEASEVATAKRMEDWR